MRLATVGILGGMGPEATILLMQKVVAAVDARDDADHIPLLVDQRPQVPSRIRFLLERRGEDPGAMLAGMAARLEAAGAAAIAMPCNTAHHFAPAIRAAVTVPFLDMVALSVARAAVQTEAAGTVGILASPAVRRVGLFDAPLAAAGLRALYAADDDAMLTAIRRIKAGDTGSAARDALRSASLRLLDLGAHVQMIACTEFSLIADAAAPGAHAFDTLDCLVAAIVRFSQDGGSAAPVPAATTGAALPDHLIPTEE